jgi:hypothetical protein
MLAEVLNATLASSLPRLLRERLTGRLDEHALELISTAANRIPDG